MSAVNDQSRPLAPFLGIAFGVSYVLGVPFNIWASSVLDGSTVAGVYVPRLITVIGPAIAGLILAHSGRGIGVDRLVGSLKLRRADVPWVAACAAIGLSVGLLAFVIAGVPAPELLTRASQEKWRLVGHIGFQVVVIGVGEELGWRGWLLPTLSAQHSFRRATLLTGLAWAAWHLPPFLSDLTMALRVAVLLASLTVIFSWLWLRTRGATVVTVIAHGFVNAPLFFFEQVMRPSISGDAPAVRAFSYCAALYAILALAVGVSGRHMWRSRDYLPPRM